MPRFKNLKTGIHYQLWVHQLLHDAGMPVCQLLSVCRKHKKCVGVSLCCLCFPYFVLVMSKGHVDPQVLIVTLIKKA